MAAKAYGFYLTQNYRQPMAYSRATEFSTGRELRDPRKITWAVGRIKCGMQKKLELGNLDAYRDWCYAGDHVLAMWQMLQLEQPDDFVVATGESHRVREFLEIAFSAVQLDWQEYVSLDQRQLRPAEVDFLLGDASKARSAFGWKPSGSFPQPAKTMVDADVELAKREESHGHS